MSPTTLLNYKMAKEKGEREREKKRPRRHTKTPMTTPLILQKKSWQDEFNYKWSGLSHEPPKGDSVRLFLSGSCHLL